MVCADTHMQYVGQVCQQTGQPAVRQAGSDCCSWYGSHVHAYMSCAAHVRCLNFLLFAK